MKWTLPNILTVLRLIAAPSMVVLFLYFNRPYADWFALLLFVVASITDYFDGQLARSWKQETKFGAMLDPIADKAMVTIALLVIIGFSSLSASLVLPATLILFREIFVSGLREYLGNSAKTLQVTDLAKWKTFAQMVAIATLFSQGIFEHYLAMSALNLDPLLVQDILNETGSDELGLRWKHQAMLWSGQAGFWLLWLATTLTLYTGFVYFKKAWPLLQEGKQ